MSSVAEAALPHERVKPNARMLGLLAVGHLTVDSIQGAFPAILPTLRDAHGLSYEAAGAIILISNLTSSVIQPAFGYLSDRSARRWLLPWAVCLAGLGFALIGLAPTYWTVLALTVVAGIGIAAYHPEGYKTAASVAGDFKAMVRGEEPKERLGEARVLQGVSKLHARVKCATLPWVTLEHALAELGLAGAGSGSAAER